MQARQELTASYLALSEQIRSMLTRDSIATNIYLYKHINRDLVLPLYILAEERKIAAIGGREEDLVRAIQDSGLAKVINGREVQLIDYPTVKIPLRYQGVFPEVEQVLKQAKKKYQLFPRVDRQYVSLTIYEQDDSFLTELIPSLSQQIQFERTSLLEDMKSGANHVKKIKQEQRIQSNASRPARYSFDKPPQVFIRRAVDSSDSEEKSKPKKTQAPPKKYKPTKEEPPKFNSDDFPTLT